MRGTMLWFNEDKNFGFIQTEEGERLYVHRDGFLDGEAPVGRCAGLPVQFDVEGTDGDRAAVRTILIEDAAPRRARRRHGARG